MSYNDTPHYCGRTHFGSDEAGTEANLYRRHRLLAETRHYIRRTTSYNEIGTLFDQNFEKLSAFETRLDRIESAMATGEDVKRLGGRLDEQGKKLDQIFHVL